MAKKVEIGRRFFLTMLKYTPFILLVLCAVILSTMIPGETFDIEIQSHDAPTSSIASVVLVSYIFGSEIMSKKYLQLFVESARGTGVDLVLLGDSRPSFELPPNVVHHHVTWEELCDRVQANVLDGSDPTELRNAPRYKAIDFKPLLPTLFPEVTDRYDWWGHVDNDMVLGNLRHFLNRKRLQDFDIISGLPHEYTWGPLTLYRNDPRINGLFRQATRPLVDIFNTKEAQVFDEWGGGSDRNQGKYYESTMSGIVERNQDKVRWMGGIHSVWDGFCAGQKEGNACSQCWLNRSGKQRLEQDCFGQKPCREHVFLCHFEFTKNSVIEASLQDANVMKDLLLQDTWRINFDNGVQAAQRSR